MKNSLTSALIFCAVVSLLFPMRSDAGCPDVAVLTTSLGETRIGVGEIDHVVALSPGSAKIVLADGSELSFSDSEILTLRFVDSAEVGVDAVSVESGMRMEDDAIVSESGAEVEIIDSSGRCVMVSNRGRIPLCALPKGVYFARDGRCALGFVVK